MTCAHVIEMDSETIHRERKSPLARAEKIPRIVLADDQPEVLHTVSSILKDECQIVGLADNGEQVIQLAQTISPDLLVLDIFMPALSGFDVAIRLRDSGSLTKILFLTVHEDSDFVRAAISLGALGYVLKAHLITDLIPAIRHVLDDELYVSPGLVSGLFNS
jgi:DNA-binding NarL/FixJ family response regulator